MKKIAIIIGAGPAGLTAAYELVTKTDIKPIVIEQSDQVGGISKTVNYKGNRIDIGGHRFFSKSDTVMDWWRMIMPMQASSSIDDIKIKSSHPDYNPQKTLDKKGVDPEKNDRVLLFRNRLSRIFFLRQFFDYPISLNFNTLKNLGIVRLFRIGLSYIWIKFFPKKSEDSLENFFINRFGTELYQTFFKDYTEKVWGVPCSKISSEWGAQRIKDLSVTRTLLHAFKSIFKKDKSISQKDTDTSLIGQFLYPKLGPGSMWEAVADLVEQKGGEILLNAKVSDIFQQEGIISSVRYTADGQSQTCTGDYFFSTMSIKELVAGMNNVPNSISQIANGLQYRDFITVGLLLNKMKIQNQTQIPTMGNIVPDNWIYIQEREVKVGRVQIFNNWSPYMVKDKDKVWIGLEYFCNEGDELWSKTDSDFMDFAIEELSSIDMIEKGDVLDRTLIRMPKTYPAYFGTYGQFDELKTYMNKIDNLFLIGRNGMHKYNNADHSMLTAITAVENIIHNRVSKENIWEINTEEDYHEKK